jgi:hypothetical protein
MPPNTLSASQFDELNTIRNSEGLTAVITRKQSNGAISVAIFKEFERNGVLERSPFFQTRQIEQAVELLQTARAWIKQHASASGAAGERSARGG